MSLRFFGFVYGFLTTRPTPFEYYDIFLGNLKDDGYFCAILIKKNKGQVYNAIFADN